MLTVKKYDQKVNQEMYRVKGLKSVWGTDGKGYAERYGSEEEGLRQARIKVDQKYYNIADIMDHVVAESRKVYEGTEFENTFLIFHDGLKQWWTEDAQLYMHEIHNMRDRQLRAYGDTNKGSKYYYRKVVGDSPELCPLDNYLFADLERCINFHVALSSFFPDHTDSRCFHLGTPQQVESTMFRCWEVEPKLERIVDDIKKYPGTLVAIIGANGTIVKNDMLRSGRRAERHQHNPNFRQRTTRVKGHDMVVQIHPDVQIIWDGLLMNPTDIEKADHLRDLLAEVAPDDSSSSSDSEDSSSSEEDEEEEEDDPPQDQAHASP